MYHIVETEDVNGRSCYIIPSTWMIHEKGICYWPPGPRAETLVKCKKPPNPTTWTLYPAKVLKTVASYDEARKWLKIAEYESDLNTENEDEQTQKRRRSCQEVSVQDVRVNGGGDTSDDDADINMPALNLPSPPHFSLDIVENSDLDENYQLSDMIFSENDVINAQDGCSQLQKAGTTTSTGLMTPQNLTSTSKSKKGITSKKRPTFVVRNETSAGLMTPQSLTPVSTSMRKGIVPKRLQTSEARSESEVSVEIGLLRKMAEDLSIIKQTVFNLDNRMEKVEKRLYNDQPLLASRETKIMTRQLISLQEFQGFESRLSDETLTVLKRGMMACGGDTVVEFVGRIMRKLMGDQLARKFSLWGQKDNENFSSTKSWKALKGAALSMQKLGPDEKTIEKACMNWFRHSGDRLKTAKVIPDGTEKHRS